jgi:hypothetical protein
LSKKAAATKNESQPVDRFASYEEASDELFQPAGYWQPELGPIHGKLVGGYQYQQKSGRGKGQLRTVYLFDLADPCPASVVSAGANGRKEVTDGELRPREICAVWGSAGLRALNELAGCFVRLERKPDKKVLSNGNEMWAYTIQFRGKKCPLEIREPFASSGPGREPGDDSDERVDPDDLPF